MPLLAPNDPAIVAVASDVALPGALVPVFDLNDVESIVEILISRAVPLAAVLAPARIA
jgi:molybdopterin-guanine dinucleotide biosynthesis protein B